MDKKNRRTVRISSWGDDRENEIMSGLVDDFNRLHPGIRAELQPIPYFRYSRNLFRLVEEGKAPDVVFINTGNVPEIFASDILAPLEDLAAGMPLDDFDRDLVARFTAGGHLYAIPRDIAPDCVIFYNKAAFTKAGVTFPRDDWTWDDLLSAAVKLTLRSGTDTVQWGFSDDAVRPEPWMYSSGGRWVDDVDNPTRYVFNESRVAEGLRFRAGLILRHGVMPSPGLLRECGKPVSQMFLEGSLAMFFSGMWYAPHFRDAPDLDWDIVMFPEGPGGRSFAGVGSGYGILSSSPYRQEAWELLRYASGPQGQRTMTAAGLIQPAMKSLMNAKEFLDGKPPANKKMLLKAVRYGVYDPMIPDWSETHDTLFLPMLESVWEGREDAVAALSRFYEELQRVLPLPPDRGAE